MKQKKIVITCISLAILTMLFYFFWTYKSQLFMKIRDLQGYEAVADID